MNRRVLLPALLILGPLLLGALATLAWWALDPERTLQATTPLHRLPLLLALGWAVLAGTALLTEAICAHRAHRREKTLLQDAAASRHRLVARLDHEIKNPLQGIRAALADEPTERQRASIDMQSKRLMTLLRDLRKIGEIESMPLETGVVDLAALAQEAVAAVQDQPGAAARRWSVTFPTAPRPLPPVHGDEDLLFLVLLNVLGNAVKYSADGDAIEVRGRLEDTTVVVEIADTGRGIAADEIAMVWEELGRSREVRGIEGSGLGLPMVRAILERHGGSASITSYLGEGSTLTLRLPAAMR